MAIISCIQALAALYVFYVSAMSLNKMSKTTQHIVRYAHISLCAGSAAGLASCIGARDIFECLFSVGIALYMAGTRRRYPA